MVFNVRDDFFRTFSYFFYLKPPKKPGTPKFYKAIDSSRFYKDIASNDAYT